MKISARQGDKEKLETAACTAQLKVHVHLMMAIISDDDQRGQKDLSEQNKVTENIR